MNSKKVLRSSELVHGSATKVDEFDLEPFPLVNIIRRACNFE